MVVYRGRINSCNGGAADVEVGHHQKMGRMSGRYPDDRRRPSRASCRYLAPRLSPTRSRARAGVLDDHRRDLRLDPAVPGERLHGFRATATFRDLVPAVGGRCDDGRDERSSRWAAASGSSRHSLAHMPQNPSAACSGIPHGHVAGVGWSRWRSPRRRARAAPDSLVSAWRKPRLVSAASLRLDEHPASWTGGNSPSSALLLQDRRTRAPSSRTCGTGMSA